MPLLTGSTGSYNQHFHACTASGVEPDDLNKEMSEALQSIVRNHEQHSAEMIFGEFVNAAAVAIVAHGLSLMAFFGSSIQELSVNNFGSDKNCLKSVATIGTWLVTGVAYAFLLWFLMPGSHFPNLSGEGEWKNKPDFGLVGTSCYDENPWMTDFEGKIAAGGGTIVSVLNIINIVVVVLNAFAHWKTAGTNDSKAKTSESFNSVVAGTTETNV